MTTEGLLFAPRNPANASRITGVFNGNCILTLRVDRQVLPILFAFPSFAPAMLLKPNCCKRPHLHAVQILDKAPDNQLAIFRCDACEAYWRAAINAWAMIEGAIDEFGGFHRLTTDEAVKVLRANR